MFELQYPGQTLIYLAYVFSRRFPLQLWLDSFFTSCPKVVCACDITQDTIQTVEQLSPLNSPAWGVFYTALLWKQPLLVCPHIYSQLYYMSAMASDSWITLQSNTSKFPVRDFSLEMGILYCPTLSWIIQAHMKSVILLIENDMHKSCYPKWSFLNTSIQAYWFR